MLAETIALLYLYYYLQDVVHYRDPGDGQLILILIATVAAIIATVAVGRVADLSGGYRRYAVLSSVLMAATGFVLAGYAAWALVIVCAFALGAGYGAFQSVSQALSLVVLPSPANAGRDLGIINIASAVPQVIGAPIAGLVVAGAGGYRGLFVFAGVLALGAGRAVLRPRPVLARAASQPVSCTCQAAASSRRAPYCSRTPGSPPPQRSLTAAAGQHGGSAVPASAQAACRAAPSATYSAASGTATGRPNTAGAIARTACRLGRAAGEHDPARGDPAGAQAVDRRRRASTAPPRPRPGPGSPGWRWPW